MLLLLLKILFFLFFGLATARVNIFRSTPSWRSRASNVQLSDNLNKWLNSVESDDQWMSGASSNSKWNKKARFNNKWSNEVNTGSSWAKGIGPNSQWSTRSKFQSYSYNHHNGIDIRKDHGWDRYPSIDKIPMPAVPSAPSRRAWPTWLPPIRMIKLPLDTPPERTRK